jgi:hypothetical protein
VNQKKPAIPPLTPGQAQFVLAQAVAERKLTYNDIVSYTARIQDEVRTLEARLAQLRAVASSHVVVESTAGRPGGNGRSRARRGRRRVPKPITPAHRASMKLQGQYLGLLRRLPETKKAQMKKLAQEKGREAAVKQMRASTAK